MAWIESHQTLGQHPKTRKLARILNVSLPTAVGYLHYLWWWAMDYAQDGDLSRFEPEDIADAALWEGEAKSFIDALIKAGFLDLDKDNNLLIIHDWDEYAGRLIEKKKANRERQKRWREQRVSNALVTRDICVSNRATIPNLTKPNHIYNPPYNSPLKGGQDEAGATEDCVISGESLLVEMATGEPKEVSHSKTRKRAKKTLTSVQQARFDKFWAVWPNKVSKGQAEATWAKLDPDDELTEKIIEGVKRAMKYDKRFQPGGFTPHASTWLNAKGWEDEYHVPGGESDGGNGADEFYAALYRTKYGISN